MKVEAKLYRRMKTNGGKRKKMSKGGLCLFKAHYTLV